MRDVETEKAHKELGSLSRYWWKKGGKAFPSLRDHLPGLNIRD